MILAAVDAGDDPFTAALFALGVELARERSFLRSDQAVYRQEIVRGRVWQVRLPGLSREASGLYLDQPKSVLWKFRARRDGNAPVGGSFLFLAVRGRERQWVFSTDPVHHVSIKNSPSDCRSKRPADLPTRWRPTRGTTG